MSSQISIQLPFAWGVSTVACCLGFQEQVCSCLVPCSSSLQIHIPLITSMSGDSGSFVVPFLGALQASIAVLLTIFAGVIAAQFNLLGEASSKEISKVCVKLFLPALLIVNVGSQLHADTVA